jgi:tetratricopeptide (TPR) repeat protein
MFKNRYILFLCLSVTAFMLCACSLHPLHKAKEVVAVADSIRESGYNISAEDSTQLAEAYGELRRWQWLYSKEYMHICYHYGCLLQEKENPVGAMQAFIHATHINSRDDLLLGRVYVKMGTICNIARDYQLTSDIYALAAHNYLRAGDTLRYCKALQLRAIALANQGKTDETTNVLKRIEQCSTDNNDELLFIRSLAFHHADQYDSALYYLKAYLNFLETDSNSTSPMREFLSIVSPMLGMLEDDSEENKLDWNDVMGFIFGIKEQVKADGDMTTQAPEEYVQATRILWNDIHRKKSFAWIYSIVVVLLIVGIGIALYYNHQEKKHALWSQKINDVTSEYTDLQQNKLSHIESTRNVLLASESLQKDLNWRNFDQMCAKVDELFYLLAGKLRLKRVLNETEVRLCVLIFIGLDHDQIALTLPYARNSVGKLKDQTAKKLGTTGRNLRDFLVDLALKA